MRILNGLDDMKIGPRAAVAAIGNFDGVHRGHRKVLAAALDWAAELGGPAAVITFRNHPREVLDPSAPPPVLLQTLDDRLDAIAHAGIQTCLLLAFDTALARTTAREFMERVVQAGLGARGLVMVERARFGRGGEGTAEVVRALGPAIGMDVRVVAAMEEGGATLSSTAIRTALAAGDVARAALYLGRPFRLPGTVVAGEGRGRSIGFATANQRPAPHVIVPARGVYATRAETGGDREFPSVTNIGVRPTFGADSGLQIETHLIGVDIDLAGKTLKVDFIRRLRDERKFGSVDELKAQIARDIAAATRQ
jgi:riboflavin kinase / FMN adenylyltransferase